MLIATFESENVDIEVLVSIHDSSTIDTACMGRPAENVLVLEKPTVSLVPFIMVVAIVTDRLVGKEREGNKLHVSANLLVVVTALEQMGNSKVDFRSYFTQI